MASENQKQCDPKPTSRAMQALVARGYVNQCSSLAGLDALLGSQQAVPVYVGFDATADSLHVGHLLPIMMLRRLQQYGHKPVILVGGGTTRIGDPSFRTEARPMLTDAHIAANIAGIRRVFDQFLDFEAPDNAAILVNNADWLDQLRYIEVLRDVGACFSVNRMLSFDSVKSRLERQENLSFLEFNYMILQAFDFLELHRTQGCRVQLGGADQWANILNGIDLVRRKEQAEVYGLTAPLLTNAAGAKMGKTASGAVWLNADRLCAYDYWQFWRNTADTDVRRFLRLFTDLSLEDIGVLEHAQGAQLNAAKERLAMEATTLAHGAQAAQAAKQAADTAFSGGRDASDLPCYSIPATADGRASLVDILVASQSATSKTDARRLIRERAVKVDGVVIAIDASADIRLPPNQRVRVSVGKKRHFDVEPLAS